MRLTKSTLLNTGNAPASTAIGDNAASGVTPLVSGTPPLVNVASTIFSGSGSTISMGNVLDWDGSTPFGLWVWAKFTAGLFVFVAKGGDQDVGYLFDYYSPYLRIYCPGSVGILFVRASWVADGAWHQFGVTFDGTKTAAGVTFYIDGAPQANNVVFDTLSGSLSNTHSFSLGSEPAGETTTGKMDEVSVFASTAPVPYNMGTPTNLTSAANGLAWWRMGDPPDTATGTIYDRIGSNNGTPFNITFSTDVP